MAKKEDDMSNWNLTLTFDWNSGAGRFATKTWTKTTDGASGPPVADFIAADVVQNDTISFTLVEQQGLNVRLNQLVVIFTKQPGAGEEVCSPITWTDPNNGNTGVVLGMVIFIPDPQPAPIPPTSGWSSVGCPTYPTIAGGAPVPLTIGVNGPNAFESTVCAEIWDDHPSPFRRFYTHDPDMDVTN
jgi:hypothetical protein